MNVKSESVTDDLRGRSALSDFLAGRLGAPGCWPKAQSAVHGLKATRVFQGVKTNHDPTRACERKLQLAEYSDQPHNGEGERK